MAINKIEELTEAVKFLGFDPEKIADLATFKADFNKEFVAKKSINPDEDYVKAIVGKKLGTVENKIKNTFKAFNVEFTPGELSDKTLEEIAEIGLKKFSDFANTSIAAEKAKASDPSKEVKEWQEKYNKLEGTLNSEIALKNTTIKTFNDFKAQVDTDKKQSVISGYKDNGWKSFKWGSAVASNDLLKKGFQATIEEKYKIALDENNNPFVTDVNGERIPSAKKTGEHATFAEVLESEGTAAKVWGVADNKGVGRQQQAPTVVKLGDGEPQVRQPFIHPNALNAIKNNPISKAVAS